MLEMFIKIVKKIPFIISVLAFINIVFAKISEIIVFAKISETIEFTVLHKVLIKITKMQFNNKLPIYFNYWIIYTIFAIIISIVLALTKKYSLLETILSIGCNSILCIVIFIFAINRM